MVSIIPWKLVALHQMFCPTDLFSKQMKEQQLPSAPSGQAWAPSQSVVVLTQVVSPHKGAWKQLYGLILAPEF